MRGRNCRELVERWLAEGDFDLLLPEVAALRGVPQPEKYHAEGDAFIHTMLALESVDDDADPRVFWGVLLHDIGKATTTVFIEGRWQEGFVPQLGISAADQQAFDSFFAEMQRLKGLRGRDGRRAFTIPVDESSRDEEFARDLGQVVLVSHLDMIIAVLNALGVPHEDGFFAKDLDAKH